MRDNYDPKTMEPQSGDELVKWYNEVYGPAYAIAYGDYVAASSYLNEAENSIVINVWYFDQDDKILVRSEEICINAEDQELDVHVHYACVNAKLTRMCQRTEIREEVYNNRIKRKSIPWKFVFLVSFIGVMILCVFMKLISN